MRKKSDCEGRGFYATGVHARELTGSVGSHRHHNRTSGLNERRAAVSRAKRNRRKAIAYAEQSAVLVARKQLKRAAAAAERAAAAAERELKRAHKAAVIKRT